MKKLLLVLTVVAMASFLLVGCLGTTPVTVTGVTLDQTTLDLTAGGATGTLVATVVPADAADKTVTWDSSAEAVATVAAGVVTPLTEGTSTITVTTVDGGLTATCEVTVAAAVVPVTPVAPITPVAPTITAIDDQEVPWDSAPWTYPVVATPGTGTITGFSLTGEPATMTISAAGLITWTDIAPVPAVHAVTVRVDASDGEFDTEAFVITVTEPVVPDFVASIVYDPLKYYSDGTYKYIRGGDVKVTVTLLEALVAGDYLEIQWNDGTGTGGNETLVQVGTTLVYEATVDFSDVGWDGCELVCVEVLKGSDCCPDQTFTDIVKVDSVAPYANLYLTFTDCTEECDEAPTSANFSFTSTTAGEGCCDDEECCGDDCSDFASWSLEIVPHTNCDPYCEFIDGDTCPVEGVTACDCLDYATEGEVEYEVDYILTDKVGNTFTDTWTITLDTDSVVSVVVPEGVDNLAVVFGTEFGIYTDKCEVED